MKRTTIIAMLLGIATLALADSYPVWYDILYDQNGTSLTSVACSSGENGLLKKGYSTFGDLPTFPFIGGAPQIEGYDSINCGTCWQMIYVSPDGQINSNWFTAINTVDTSPPGYSISMAGMNYLTGSDAQTHDGAMMVLSQDTQNLCGL